MSQQARAMVAGQTSSAWWLAVGARATLAVAAGLVIAFSADHSSQFGLVVFGVFGLATAITLAWCAEVAGQSGARGLLRVHAALTAIAGIVALVSTGAGYGVLVALVVVWGVTAGATEIVLWHRMRARHAFARDWLAAGILTLVLAAAVLAIPADFTNAWQVENKDGSSLSGIVTAEIFIVGIFGAYAIVLGVFLLIAAVSARGITGAVPRTDEHEPATVSGV